VDDVTTKKKNGTSSGPSLPDEGPDPEVETRGMRNKPPARPLLTQHPQHPPHWRRRRRRRCQGLMRM